MAPAASLPSWPPHSVLVVVAHPDDESFGLGGIIASLTETGVPVDVVCFTRGEASTLGAGTRDLAAVRADELTRAAAVLGVRRVQLLDHPDGALASQSLEDLAGTVVTAAAQCGADALLTFDHGGITGHPDHQRATDAALSAGERLDLAVLGWAIPQPVAAALNTEFATGFVGRTADEVDHWLPVDRDVQQHAILCHASQATDNPVLARRLALMQGAEALRVLRHPSHDRSSAPSTR